MCQCPTTDSLSVCQSHWVLIKINFQKTNFLGEKVIVVLSPNVHYATMWYIHGIHFMFLFHVLHTATVRSVLDERRTVLGGKCLTFNWPQVKFYSIFHFPLFLNKSPRENLHKNIVILYMIEMYMYMWVFRCYVQYFLQRYWIHVRHFCLHSFKNMYKT